MSEKKQAVNSTENTYVATTPKQTAIQPKTKVDNSELFAALKEAKTEDLDESTGEYIKLKENETYHFICTGLSETEMNTENGKALTTVAELIDENNVKGIHGSIVLVNAMKKRNGNFPCAMRIITGKSKSIGGGKKYLEMQIFTAN